MGTQEGSKPQDQASSVQPPVFACCLSGDEQARKVLAKLGAWAAQHVFVDKAALKSFLRQEGRHGQNGSVSLVIIGQPGIFTLRFFDTTSLSTVPADHRRLLDSAGGGHGARWVVVVGCDAQGHSDRLDHRVSMVNAAFNRHFASNIEKGCNPWGAKANTHSRSARRRTRAPGDYPRLLRVYT